MSILRVRDSKGNITEIPAIKGDKGDKGEKGERGDPGAVSYETLTPEQKKELTAEGTALCAAVAAGVTTIEQNNNAPLKFWVGSQDEYDAIAEPEQGCFYIISDDTDLEDFTAALNVNRKAITANEAAIKKNANAIEINETNILAHNGLISKIENMIKINEIMIENNKNDIAQKLPLTHINEKIDVDVNPSSTEFYADLRTVIQGLYERITNSAKANGANIIANKIERFIISCNGYHVFADFYCISNLYGVIRIAEYAETGPKLSYISLHGGIFSDVLFENPPMAEGVEYCTLEKYLGRRVYTKLLKVGANTEVYLEDKKRYAIRCAHGIENLEFVKSVSAIHKYDSTIFNEMTAIGKMSITNTEVQMGYDTQLSAGTVYIELKYTKSS